MVPVGAFITLLGLIGLIYCMGKAYQAKKTGLEGEELTNHLKSLVAVNMAAFFLSVIGLAVVVIGVLL